MHFSQFNPNIDFANSPFYVNTTLSEWKANVDYYNPRPEQALIAYHNQAVTNMIIPHMPEASQILTIGSPGKEDNMRWRYIWHALDQVLEGGNVENLCFKDMGQWNWIVPKKVKGVDIWP